EPEQVRGVGARTADGVEQGEFADVFDEHRAPGAVRVVEGGDGRADRLEHAMHVDPRRLGAGAGDKIQRTNVAGEVVGAEIDEDSGGRRAAFVPPTDRDAPETPRRQIAAESG